MSKEESFNIKRLYNREDIIMVLGYGASLWKVEGYTYEKFYASGINEENIIYTLRNTNTQEWIEAYQEDCIATAPVQKQTKTVKKATPKNKDKVTHKADKTSFAKGLEAEIKAFADREALAHKAEPMYKYERSVDGLLDELSDLMCQLELYKVLNIKDTEVIAHLEMMVKVLKSELEDFIKQNKKTNKGKRK